jgi:hypothetical protein
MAIALLAALQIVTSSPEWVWADISMTEGRGGFDRIEILPKVVIEGGRRTLRNVVARRTFTFAGQTTTTEWTDTGHCPALRASLDAITEVKVLGRSSLSSYEGPADPPPPPPPHRTVATVKVGGHTLSTVGGDSLGDWVSGVLKAAERCWGEAPP